MAQANDPFDTSQRVVHEMVLNELHNQQQQQEEQETAANFLRRRYLEDLQAMQEDAEAAKLKADPLEFFGEGEDKQILGDKVEDEVS